MSPFITEKTDGIYLNILKKSFKLKSFKTYIALCIIIKNESDYIKEWIDYQRIIGVEKFYIYDNESNDNTKEILEPYIKQGIVEYSYIKGKQKQIHAYMNAVSKYKYDSFWIGFIDIDEFIVPIYKNSLKEILKEYEQYGGVGINWCVYGSSNRKDKPNGLVIKNFKYRAKDDFVANIHIKTIANPRYIKRFKNPHQILCKYSKKIVSPNFQILNNFYNNEIDYSKIRINHYYTKSKEEFLIKIKKGKADDKSE